ncbi:hypothetical protein ACEZDB_35840 [Streptacidiphilus sp. N1-3]|uniref:Uncharacterized protein n=1 Tax=Streptacidiphilus alkalitolerans TaxID=3342712 RepID=A0ABV6XDK6_9ACTN
MASALPVSPLPHDGYIDAVVQALAYAELEATGYRTSATEQLGEDGRPVLSALIEWDSSNPLVGDRFGRPHGFVLTWTLATGWQFAQRREDGGTHCPDSLPLIIAAAPVAVAAALARNLGRPWWTGFQDPAVRAAVEQWPL